MIKLEAVTLQNAPCFLDNTGEGKWHEIAQFQTVKVPPKKEKADILTSVCVKEALGKFSLIVSSVSIGEALRKRCTATGQRYCT